MFVINFIKKNVYFDFNNYTIEERGTKYINKLRVLHFFTSIHFYNYFHYQLHLTKYIKYKKPTKKIAKTKYLFKDYSVAIFILT